MTVHVSPHTQGLRSYLQGRPDALPFDDVPSLPRPITAVQHRSREQRHPACCYSVHVPHPPSSVPVPLRSPHSGAALRPRKIYVEADGARETGRRGLDKMDGHDGGKVAVPTDTWQRSVGDRGGMKVQKLVILVNFFVSVSPIRLSVVTSYIRYQITRWLVFAAPRPLCTTVDPSPHLP